MATSYGPCMESRPEPNVSNPYATPKTSPEDKNITYVEADGYAFGSELVANEYFKPPLICAKLGIPLEANKDHQAIPITIFSKSIIHPFLHTILNIALIIVILGCISIWGVNSVFLLVILYGLNRLLKKPYKIPFYFSEKYLSNRRNKSYLFRTIITLCIVGIIYGINHDIVQACSLLVLILILIIRYFSMQYFHHSKSKGDFHFVQGIHPNMLESAPTLPLSNKNKSPSETN